MLAIYEGTEAKIKAEMQQRKKSNLKKIKEIKAKYTRSELKRDKMDRFDKQRIANIERENKLLAVSKVIPVSVEGYVYNWKLLSRFQKKLKGFNTELEITDGRLELRYWKPRSENKGTLALYDITEYFKELKHVPKARLEGVEV